MFLNWFKNILTDIWGQTEGPIFKEIGPIGLPKTSVRNYHYPLHNNLEEHGFVVNTICCLQTIFKVICKLLVIYAHVAALLLSRGNDQVEAECLWHP
jgi:hypothetical protein